MCLGFITVFCPLNISFPTNAQAKWKISSKTALLRICLIIDSARRGKEEKKPRGRKGREPLGSNLSWGGSF